MTETKHIVSAFDKDLNGLLNMVLEMGGMVETQLDDATRVFEDRDVAAAPDVVKGDKAIDALDEKISQAVVRVLALRQPQARDLRSVVAVLKISANLERLGDYAKNMAKRTPVIAEFDPISGVSGTVRRMSQAVGGMVKDSLDAYVRGDVDLATAVRMRDEDVDQLYNTLFRELLTHMMEDPKKITPCMHMLFIAKNLERMGDHATSIAEQALYLETGQMPEDDRPKADTTPRANPS